MNFYMQIEMTTRLEMVGSGFAFPTVTDAQLVLERCCQMLFRNTGSFGEQPYIAGTRNTYPLFEYYGLVM